MIPFTNAKKISSRHIILNYIDYKVLCGFDIEGNFRLYIERCGKWSSQIPHILKCENVQARLFNYADKALSA
jgi:hypothetical protein